MVFERSPAKTISSIWMNGRMEEATMDEMHVEAVMKASAKILREMAKMDFEYGSAYVKESSFSPHDVSTVIGLSNDIKGIVVFSFPREVALAIANRFMELMGVAPAEEINENALSALAELVNTIMGHYMIAMEESGHSVNISPPTTVVGQDVTLGLGMVSKVVGVPVNLPSGVGEIAIAFK